MTLSVSIIIPNRNGAATIARCLEAAFLSRYPDFEVIVVDDCSSDESIDVIGQFPCKLVQLATHSGASAARNSGTKFSRNDLLFFTDSDCLLNDDTLGVAVDTITSAGSNVVVGGTYTERPVDDTFFNRFQSVFIAYNETRNAGAPDYVATHAMIIRADDFAMAGGFPEAYLPILEDVEFSHRMKRSGYSLVMNPAVRVRHIFGFSLARSMRNAFRKAMFWTAYSMNNNDLLKDSGAASIGLKLNTAVWLVNFLILTSPLAPGQKLPIVFIMTAINVAWNRDLLAAFRRTGGVGFLATATAYYILLYPIAVGAGGVAGMLRYRWLIPTMRNTD